jgi:hypothetical protein
MTHVNRPNAGLAYPSLALAKAWWRMCGGESHPPLLDSGTKTPGPQARPRAIVPPQAPSHGPGR